MRRLKSLVRRTLVVTSLIVAARMFCLVRRHAAARRVLGRALSLAPDSYAAHHLLARIALAEGFRTEAMREIRICARLDPGRSDRLDIPGSLGRSLDTGIDQEVAHDLPPSLSGSPAPVPPPGSDFSGAEEWERFRDLPPIDAEDIAAVDMDALLEQLVRHPRPRRTRGT